MKQIKGFAIAAAVCIGAALVCGGVLQVKHSRDQEETVSVQAEQEILEETTKISETEKETEDAVELSETAESSESTAENPETEKAAESMEEITETEGNAENPEKTEEDALSTAALSDFPSAAPDLIAIDYVDYEDGMVFVYFQSRAEWSEPIVLVRDEAGTAYPAKIQDISADGCTIRVSQLESGKEYQFLLGGLSEKESKKSTILTGYFEKPEIAPGA
ncbi:MAG: hypothetical protein ACI39W_09850 [Brotaphodocola sp.]